MLIIYDEFIKNIELFLSLTFFTYMRLSVFLIISIINIMLDLKYQRIFPLLLIITSVFFLVSWIIIKPVIALNLSAGYIVIITFYSIIYLLSKGKTGLGDMLYMIFFSSMFGYFFSVFAFLISYWLASAVLIVPLLLKKISMKSRIPFIPFLFSGCVLVIVYSLWLYN